MKTYYLIDFENLHEDALKITKKANKEDSLIIFYTSNSPKISLDAFEGQKAKNEVIKVKAGKQSLDMCLVSYLGYLIKSDGKNCNYVIISDDCGFDNVVSFWKERKITTVSRQEKPIEAKTAVKPDIPKNKSKISAADKTELSNRITKTLNEANPKIDNKTVGEISSLAVKSMGEGKQAIYLKLIQKYGQKKGLQYYNSIKKAI